ncbi:MAG TPA: peptide-methionine (S)-S-oxide reductase MsrA [Candidatus Thioglobus sp.]|nr:peptide-methionine (S)-S-oxide reductase MsrA [Candidatus Thioglobus sp.]
MLLEIVFAAGCFWGVEKNFEHFDGVVDVVSGYSGGSYEDPTYELVLENRTLQNEGFLAALKNIGKSDAEIAADETLVNHTESVRVTYDSSIVSTEVLIKNFWQIHNPTQVDGQGNDIGNNYRSALYWTTETQRDIAFRTKDEFQALLTAEGYGAIVTEMKPLDTFWPAEDYHQDFLLKNPYGYCPEYSTGVAFEQKKLEENDFAILTPLGGQEIIIVEAEVKGSCLYCLQFEREVSNNYKGTIPLRTAPASSLQGFELTTETWATPTIFFIEDGVEVWASQGYMSANLFYKALGEFKLGKGSEAFHVAFNEGTDRPYCQQYEIFKNTPDGVFIDKLSGRTLFDTKDRFNSTSGWLSFTKPVDNEVYEKPDYSFGMVRTEIRSVSSDIHLGHVFDDGPDGQPRYCINATVLEFVPS